jgi:hypothetical protein
MPPGWSGRPWPPPPSGPGTGARLRITGLRIIVAFDQDALPAQARPDELGCALEHLGAAATVIARRFGLQHTSPWARINVLTRGRLLAMALPCRRIRRGQDISGSHSPWPGWPLTTSLGRGKGRHDKEHLSVARFLGQLLLRRMPKKRDMTGYSASFCLHRIEVSGGNLFSGQPWTTVARRSRRDKLPPAVNGV